LGAGAGDLPKYDILLHIDEVVCGVGRTGNGSATSITASSPTS
jgi:adenosylmethionine-8-amino-7-oxononanoate aminotransferase